MLKDCLEPPLQKKIDDLIDGEQIIKEVNNIGYEYERTDENYVIFINIIEKLKQDLVLNISLIDELEEIYNDRNNANIFFFKAGINFCLKNFSGVTKG